TAFSSENRIKKGFDFSQYEKVSLKKDESIRITVPEEVVSGWVHNLRSPSIKDGAPEMETKTREKDKSQYTVHVMERISGPRCLGSEEVLREQAMDPDSCPMCA